MTSMCPPTTNYPIAVSRSPPSSLPLAQRPSTHYSMPARSIWALTSRWSRHDSKRCSTTVSTAKWSANRRRPKIYGKWFSIMNASSSWPTSCATPTSRYCLRNFWFHPCRYASLRFSWHWCVAQTFGGICGIDKISFVGQTHRSGILDVHHIPVGHQFPVLSVLQRRHQTGDREQCGGQCTVCGQLVFGRCAGAANVARLHATRAEADCREICVLCREPVDFFVGEWPPCWTRIARIDGFLIAFSDHEQCRIVHYVAANC